MCVKASIFWIMYMICTQVDIDFEDGTILIQYIAVLAIISSGYGMDVKHKKNRKSNTWGQNAKIYQGVEINTRHD